MHDFRSSLDSAAEYVKCWFFRSAVQHPAFLPLFPAWWRTCRGGKSTGLRVPVCRCSVAWVALTNYPTHTHTCMRTRTYGNLQPNGVVWMTCGSRHNFSLVEKESAALAGRHRPTLFLSHSRRDGNSSTSSLPCTLRPAPFYCHWKVSLPQWPQSSGQSILSSYTVASL